MSKSPSSGLVPVKVEAGYGATEADLERGHLDPDIKNSPEYQLENYKRRGSLPQATDDSIPGFDFFSPDLEFQQKELRSQGFLTRQYPSRERN